MKNRMHLRLKSVLFPQTVESSVLIWMLQYEEKIPLAIQMKENHAIITALGISTDGSLVVLGNHLENCLPSVTGIAWNNIDAFCEFYQARELTSALKKDMNNFFGSYDFFYVTFRINYR